MKHSLKAVRKLAHQLCYILTRKQKKKAVFVFGAIVMGAFCELLGITALLPFAQILTTPEKVMSNEYVKSISRVLKLDSSQEIFILFGFGIMLIYILKNVCILFSQFVQCDYSTQVQKDLSVKMLASYLSRPYTYFLNTNSSEILRGTVTDITGTYEIIAYSFEIMAEALTVLIIGIYLMLTDFFIAIGALSIMLIVLFFMVSFYKPTTKKIGNKNVKVLSKKNKYVNQAANGIKEILVAQRREYFIQEYEKAAEESRKIQKKFDFMTASPNRIIEGFCISGIIGIIVFRISMGADMLEFIPTLATFAMAAFRIMPSIGKITSRLTNIIYRMPMLENVYSNIRAVEKQRIVWKEKTKDCLEQKDRTFCNQLQIDHIVWKYDEQKKPVLNGTTLTINKGESVALIGSSGSGKTTLVDCILGLLRPQKGSVRTDGIDVYTIPKEWAHIVGYVPQSVFLIDDTIRNNIAFGIETEAVNDIEIWDVLEKAQLKEFVEKLPNKLDTLVGERGAKLSGGQRQRIAIARALYNQPQILVLDEATAALDNETEESLMKAIEMLQGHITIIIVAHRLATIRNCDTVYAIEDGIAVRRDKEEVLRAIGKK